MIDTTLFGIRLCVFNLDAAAEYVLQETRSEPGGIVCVANVDMVTRATRDPKLKDIMRRSRAVLTDGAPLVWALQRKGFVDARRVYGPHLMRKLCGLAELARTPIFLYGGSSDELNKLTSGLSAEFPSLVVAGAISPPILPTDPPLDMAIVERINHSGAALLFVGLGCPKQEYWINTHAPHLTPLSVGVGLAFAQIAGTKPEAPEWMQRNGLEWVYRLKQEPRRLWRRYLIGNTLFIWHLMRARFGLEEKS